RRHQHRYPRRGCAGPVGAQAVPAGRRRRGAGDRRPGPRPPAVGCRMSMFVSLDTYDVRFPTSRELDGSDAMNPDPDYSAAYVVLRTDSGDGLEGHGFAFTIGRGNDVQAAAIEALRPYLGGRSVEALLGDLGGFWKELVHDSQLRWLGPEKGVMQ